MNGRIIGEAIVVSVSGIILLVILGLRYVSESAGESSASTSFAVSSGFLTLLFFSIVFSITIVEAVIRMRERKRWSKGRIFRLIGLSAPRAPRNEGKRILNHAIKEVSYLRETSFLEM